MNNVFVPALMKGRMLCRTSRVPETKEYPAQIEQTTNEFVMTRTIWKPTEEELSHLLAGGYFAVGVVVPKGSFPPSLFLEIDYTQALA